MRALPFSSFLAATLVLAGAAAAQDSSSPGAAAAPGHQTGPGTGRMGRPDPVVLHGPPEPKEFARIVGLPADRVERYTQMYDRLMTSTRPQRDSLETLRQSMRQDVQQRHRSSAGNRRAVLRPLVQDLDRQQAAFDDTLRSFLDQDQWKRYDKWRSDERDRARKEWRGRRHDHSEGGPPA